MLADPVTALPRDQEGQSWNRARSKEQIDIQHLYKQPLSFGAGQKIFHAPTWFHLQKPPQLLSGSIGDKGRHGVC